MNAKEKIRKLIADRRGVGYANACNIWKGFSPQGYGWHYQPFGKNTEFLGKNFNEVKERFEVGE